jgi:hypothetical protein
VLLLRLFRFLFLLLFYTSIFLYGVKFFNVLLSLLKSIVSLVEKPYAIDCVPHFCVAEGISAMLLLICSIPLSVTFRGNQGMLDLSIEGVRMLLFCITYIILICINIFFFTFNMHEIFPVLLFDNLRTAFILISVIIIFIKAAFSASSLITDLSSSSRVLVYRTTTGVLI